MQILFTLLMVATFGQVTTVFIFWFLLPTLQFTKQDRTQAKLDENKAKLDTLLEAVDGMKFFGKSFDSAANKPTGGQYEFTADEEGVIKGVKTMIHHASILFAVMFTLKELAAFAQMADHDIKELAGQVADGFDWGFFGLFLWKAKASFKVHCEN